MTDGGQFGDGSFRSRFVEGESLRHPFRELFDAGPMARMSGHKLRWLFSARRLHPFPHSDRLARISQVLKQEVEQGKLPGAVVMVARKGKIAYADAIGLQDKETAQRMALDSVFRIYSMTKPLVSVAAMMLVEDGKIQLTDPVSRHLPQMKGLQVSVPKPDPVFARFYYSHPPASERIARLQGATA